MTAERLREKERAACIFNLSVSGKYAVRKILSQQACQIFSTYFFAFLLSKSKSEWRQVQYVVLTLLPFAFKYMHYKLWQSIVASLICKCAYLAERVFFSLRLINSPVKQCLFQESTR